MIYGFWTILQGFVSTVYKVTYELCKICHHLLNWYLILKMYCIFLISYRA